MEKIFFKLGDYYDACDDNMSLLEEYHDSGWIKVQEGEIYSVYRYRIVIPALHVSLREGDWYSVGEDYSSVDDDEIE